MGISEFSKIIKQTIDKSRGLLKNPLFYFGAISVALLAVFCFGQDNVSNFNDTLKNKNVFLNSFLNNTNESVKDGLFLNPKNVLALETPDLKIIDDNCVCGVSSYRVLSPQVLGAIYGEDTANSKEVTEYAVAPGDTF